MLIPSSQLMILYGDSSLSRRVNANSQLFLGDAGDGDKLIKKGEC